MIEIYEYMKEDRNSVINLQKKVVRELCKYCYDSRQIKALAKQFTKDAFDNDYEDNSKYGIVAVDDEVIIGCGLVNLKNSELKYLLVSPDYVREGVGSLLLEELEKKAKEHRVINLIINTYMNSVDFFRQGGYKLKEKNKAVLEDIEIDFSQMVKKMT